MKTVHTFSSALSRYIAGANYLTALTGAGVSAESGIPTFRGGDGLWNRYRPEELATPEAFSRDPETVWRWYAWRMERVFSALPNPAHLAFATLQERGRLRCLITQNVDDLHERAGSRDVLHLHGTLRQMRCVACGRRVPVDRPPEVPPLPVCACGALMRPDVVWFGEALQPDVLERAFAEASRSDVMIVAGTSAVVHPAAGLPLEVKRRGGTVIEINPDVTPLSSLADLSIRMPAGEAMMWCLTG